MKRVACGCIPYCEDIIGWTSRKHLSYRRSQPLHTPHIVSGYIPTQILTWPLTEDVDPSILLFMLHAILPKLLGGITRTANTTVTQSVHHLCLNGLNFRSSRMWVGRVQSVKRLGCGLDGRGSIPGRATDFYLFHIVQPGFGTRPTPYSMVTGKDCFPEVKAAHA